MEKQKICIIGGGLTGLVTAISLSKLNCEIDLVTDNFKKSLQSDRTIAISNNNLNSLIKLNIFENIEREIWPCNIMKLYASNMNKEFLKIFELNKEKENRKIFYMVQNTKLMKSMINKIKKIKNIHINTKEKIHSISDFGVLKKIQFNKKNYKYNLIILCTGHNSNLVNNTFKNQIIENSYKELAITTILNHEFHKNNIARQIFLDNEIVAFLPISNTQTSLVWTVKKDIKKKSNLFIKKKNTILCKKLFKKYRICN